MRIQMMLQPIIHYTLHTIRYSLIIVLTWFLSLPCLAVDSTVTPTVGQVGWWGNIAYKGKPWTLNVSRPCNLHNALNGRHISLWQSHGRYYDSSSKEWQWQRPYMFSTTEDLFTQTIVVPYLIPMLQNAGAVVFTPRERDMQPHEIIVDNDDTQTGYSEREFSGRWSKASSRGFRIPSDAIIPDGYNPFDKGTVRQTASSHGNECSSASYQPTIPESGRYAVYVSYSTESNSVDDAHYTVYHKGCRTEFRVNQRMGGGTWVYLGTFDFGKGSSINNRVVVSSRSRCQGVVTTDAVRFGGGMGNIARDSSGSSGSSGSRGSRGSSGSSGSGGSSGSTESLKVSGLPRFLEAARYYAQWAGAPRKVYAVYDGRNDYKDDINVRSLMTNWLSGGSPYNPDSANINPYDTIHYFTDSLTHIVRDSIVHISVDSLSQTSNDTVIKIEKDSVIHVDHIRFRTLSGKKVPFDLSLAIHSDAGYNHDMQSVYGSLSICTTDYNDGKLNAGLPRSHSKDFAASILDNAQRDLHAHYGTWNLRSLYDRNYSESRLPGIPSAIFETLSHQSFPDMRLAHDPDFKFTLARSIYKTILHYEAAAHGDTVIVEPLQPTCFSVLLNDSGEVSLSWAAQKDTLEPTAVPTGYNVYTSVSTFGYDNGIHVQSPQYSKRLVPGKMYRFRVTATNDGGESFPTEELCAFYVGRESRGSRESRESKTKTILIVNGFNRLSSPAVVDSAGYKGFDINEDPGLSYGPTACWSGHQKVFSTATAGCEGPGTFGYSGHELEGKIIAGNDFNYVNEHAEAIASLKKYNIVSASRSAVEQGSVTLSGYACIDLLLGNEKNDGHSLRPYKTFTPALQQKLRENKVPLIVSGSYIASDMQSSPVDSVFMADVLHCTLDSTVRTKNDMVRVKDLSIPLVHTLNPKHYATIRSDVLKPVGDSVPMMQYSDGSTAALAIPQKLVVMGFPFECIEDKKQRNAVMQEFLNLLIR